MIQNIFNNIPEKLSDELIEVLSENENIRIERIISKGHKSPRDHWYDQEKNEFVFLVSGEAILQFKEGGREVKMKAGDYLIIPAHEKHRVDKTSSDEDTVWLTARY